MQATSAVAMSDLSWVTNSKGFVHSTCPQLMQPRRSCSVKHSKQCLASILGASATFAGPNKGSSPKKQPAVMRPVELVCFALCLTVMQLYSACQCLQTPPETLLVLIHSHTYTDVVMQLSNRQQQASCSNRLGCLLRNDKSCYMQQGVSEPLQRQPVSIMTTASTPSSGFPLGCTTV